MFERASWMPSCFLFFQLMKYEKPSKTRKFEESSPKQNFRIIQNPESLLKNISLLYVRSFFNPM